MTLCSWKLQRELRRRIKSETLASPPPWHEHLHARRLLRSRDRTWLGRLVAVGVGSLGVAAFTDTPEALTSIILLWSIAVTLTRADDFVSHLYLSDRLHVFNHLPISDTAIFDAQSLRFLRHSLWSVLDFSILYGLLLFQLHGFTFAGAVMLGLLQWLFVTATALCLHALAPGRRFSGLTLVFVAMAIGFLFLGSRQTAVASWLNGAARWYPPVGWLHYALGLTSNAGPAGGLLSGALLAFVLGAAPLAYRRARARYSLFEAIFALARKTSGVRDPGESSQPRLDPVYLQEPATIEAAIRSRHFFAPFEGATLGPIERFTFSLLTPRERLLTEFALGGLPAWSRSLPKTLALLACFTAVGYFFRAHSGGKFPNALVFGAVLVFMAATHWRGLAPMQGIATTQSTPYTFFPIGFWELTRMILKVETVRWLIWLPFVLPALAILSGDTLLPAGLTGSPVLRFIAFCSILHPVLMLFRFSPGTTDSSNPLVVLPMAILLVFLAVNGVAVFTATSLAGVLISLLLATAASIGALLLYGRFYNKARFDLVRLGGKENPG